MILEGRRLLISGVVDERSIAFAVARRAQLEGAELLLTARPADRPSAEATAARLPKGAPPMLELDATSAEQHDALAEEIESRWGTLDGALHAIAFAPRDALRGELAEAGAEGLNLAFQTSVVSFARMAALLRRVGPEGSSLLGLDFDASRAWPVYNWMGVCKAALESAMRYLARDLGPAGIRVNLLASGPIRTRAAGGIADFEVLTEAWERGSPLRWDPDDADAIAGPACFLFSDAARAVSGQVVRADAGYSAMAAPLR